MIHAAKSPDKASKLLRLIVKHQTCALRVAGSMTLRDGELERFRDGFATELLKNGWAQGDLDNDDGPIRWLTRKGKQLGLLIRLSEAEQQIKESIINSIVADHALFEAPRDAKLAFRIADKQIEKDMELNTMSPHQLAGQFLMRYYDELYDGVANSFFPR